MSLAKQVHVGLLVLGNPGWITHAGAHTILLTYFEMSRSYTALFQCRIVMIIAILS